MSGIACSEPAKFRDLPFEVLKDKNKRLKEEKTLQLLSTLAGFLISEGVPKSIVFRSKLWSHCDLRYL